MLKRNYTIPTLLGVVSITVGTIAGVLLVQVNQETVLRASLATIPQDVRVTNITDKSFGVSWITSQNTTSQVKWSDGSSGQLITEKVLTPKQTHLVNIEGLEPNSEYSFTIVQRGTEYDNNGLPWSAKTAPEAPLSNVTTTISGVVFTPNNQPVANALVYINSGDTTPQSTQTSLNGSWFVPLSKVRTSDLKSYINTQKLADTTMDVLVISSDSKIAAAKISPDVANPLPAMILGNSYDFRNQSKNNIYDSTSANIPLP